LRSYLFIWLLVNYICLYLCDMNIFAGIFN